MPALTAAALLAGCTADDTLNTGDGGDTVAEQTVAFDAYLQRSATRSGAAGTLTTAGADGTVSLQTKGFGVMAYSTGTLMYTPQVLPNFMYNEHVTYSASQWDYEPKKYWPVGEREATAAGAQLPHRVSFFAYAPWVPVEETTGQLVSTGLDPADVDTAAGITALTRNTKTGDPMVRYDVTFDPARRVDLCWAEPRLNQTRPAGTATDPDSRVNMVFYHALAALNVQIDAQFVWDVHSGILDSDHTRIWVRSVTIQGMATRGLLNLNNSAMTSPRWLQMDGTSGLDLQPVTIYDGRRDTREAIMQAADELTLGLNPKLVQSEPYVVNDAEIKIVTPDATYGVRNDTQNLFGSGALTDPVYVISSGAPLRVNIVYDVETYDPKLPSNSLSDGYTPGSTVENNITAAVLSGDIPVKLEAGKVYTLKLHLGMRRVEAEATVSDWALGGSAAASGFDYENEPIRLNVSIEDISTIDDYSSGTTTDGEITVPAGE